MLFCTVRRLGTNSIMITTLHWSTVVSELVLPAWCQDYRVCCTFSSFVFEFGGLTYISLMWSKSRRQQLPVNEN
jgi:hypothetical protein